MIRYFAIFHQNDNNQYEVTFPDLEPNAATYGNTWEEALNSAHDSLLGYLLTCKDFEEKINKPSSKESIKLNNQNDLIIPIEVEL